jgi:sporulation protein YlmC with PRC-barrel domain
MTQDRLKAVFSLSSVCAVVVMLVTGFNTPVDARDKSGALKASDVIGMKVQDTEGKSLGSIKDLVIDPQDGDVQYAVLDFGGFAGVGDKYFAVPWEALQLNPADKKIALDVSKKDLKDAPGFDKNNWPDLSEDQQAIVIYEFYDVPRPDQEMNRNALQSKQ